MKVDNSWLRDQIVSVVEQWDNTLIDNYPNECTWMDNPKVYYDHIMGNCNYFDSAKTVNWDKIIGNEFTVLDLGCGGGWLSAYLSSFKTVNKILSVDSSINYLENFMPQIIDLMNGDISKIERVQGLFTPLLLKDNSIDLLVISSAAHHADNLVSLLNEFHRVLKPGGSLVILNETPTNNLKFTLKLIIDSAKILLDTIFHRFYSRSKKISSSGILYDPVLGDIDYPLWYWEEAFKESNFLLIDIINSGLPTIKNSKGRALINFVLKVQK